MTSVDKLTTVYRGLNIPEIIINKLSIYKYGDYYEKHRWW